MNKDQWEKLTRKEMVINEDSEGLSSNSGKPNPKILCVITDKEYAMAPFIRCVTFDPIHCIRHGCRNLRRLVAVATKFSTMAY
jgi:hypothetical protein